MAGLYIHHSFHTYKNISYVSKYSPAASRSNLTSLISCQGRQPADQPSDQPGMKNKNVAKVGMVGLYAEAGKIGKQLRESMSPRQKGDWRDVLLMSLSFAVYVYISQKLVCAYCVWISMLNQF